MALPLEGIKVIDFTGVQAGPACTQLLAWFGADVLKVERPGVGDVTRRQLRDVPDLDALYFITLNSNKKSLTLNTKMPEGKAIMEKLIRMILWSKRKAYRDSVRETLPLFIFLINAPSQWLQGTNVRTGSLTFQPFTLSRSKMSSST